MSVGRRILQARLESKKTQRDVAKLTGLAVSYVSRLENDRMTPSIRTLTRISEALGIPVVSFFDSGPVCQSRECCPVDPSGHCMLDQLFAHLGRDPKMKVAGYSPRQLGILRMCHFLLRQKDKEIIRFLWTTMRSLLAMAASKEGRTLAKTRNVARFAREWASIESTTSAARPRSCRPYKGHS